MDSEFKRENIKISIAVQDKDFYIITSEDHEGKYEVERRFKDLLALRKNLTRHWPGCYVPYIPKSISNISESDLRKLVESYLIKLISILFLYKSPIFQVFLKDTKDYSRLSFPQEPIMHISERYHKAFSHVSLNELEESYIEESIQYFTSILSKLEKIYSISERNNENYHKFALSLNTALNTLNLVGDSLAGIKNSVQIRDECINPYGILKDWILSEIFDIKGILFTIKSRRKIDKFIEKLRGSEESQQIMLEKVNNGKIGVFNKLTGKGEEEVKENVMKELMKIRHELEMAKLTAKIIDCRLSKLELPYFRKSKKYQFNTVFKAFIKANVDEFESLMQQSKHMLYIHSN